MNYEIRSIAEQCSQSQPRVRELALLELRPYMEDFLDASWLNIKLREYENWASNNSDPFLQRSLLHRPPGFNMLVASIWAARDWENVYKKESSFRPPGGAKRLINFACSLAILELHAGQLLDLTTRKYLQKRLQDTQGVWGLIHELNTFAYFVRKGAEVQPHFLNKASSQEIAVNWHGFDIPVQCKAKLPGSGRLISQDVFTRLACHIVRDARANGRKILVRIGSTGSIREEDVDFLRRQVLTGVGSSIGPALVAKERRTFTVRLQPLSGQFTVKTIQDYLLRFDFHVGMVIGEPVPNGKIYDVVAVVGIEADLQEKPWNSLLSSIKKGAKQLKGGIPGVIAIHYADPVRDFETLRRDTRPLRSILGELLNPLPHVGAVMLSSEPDLQLPGAGGPGQVCVYHRQPWPFPKDFLSNTLSN
jgi:hypothetical protein